MTKRRHMVVDTANILFRVASAHTKYGSGGTPEDQAGLALHMALNTLKSHYNKVKPDVVALTFEGRDNWRKTYTKSAECVSQRLYKGNRVKDDSMAVFFQLIENFEALVREHTSLVCLSHPLVEGDDMFSAYVQKYCGNGDEVFGLSGDKDFVQLIDLDGFTLLNPDKLGADRHKDKKGNPIDAKYFMFEKAFRGDSGDNVMSAYPRLRATRIEKAFNDDYELTNLLNETWEFAEPSTGEKRTISVREMFEENQKLMNLRKQPQHIQEVMFNTLEEAETNVGKFSMFHFGKFCGKYKLKKIAEDMTSFVPMFTNAGSGGLRPDLNPVVSDLSAQVISDRDKRNEAIMERMRAKAKLSSSLKF